jgi:hypothetical protein
MSQEILKLVKEAEQEVRSTVTGKSAVISARYGKQAGVYYEACMAVARHAVSMGSISDIFVPKIGQGIFDTVVVVQGQEMVEFVGKASGIAPSLLAEIKKQADADMVEITHTLKELVKRIGK